MKRPLISIDETKCNGCGACITHCPEGAIQIIDGKARLISQVLCDGLGACIGECPLGAMTIEEVEAQPYDEEKVMEQIVKAGPNTIAAHCNHLKEHNQMEYYHQAIAYLKKQGLAIPSQAQSEKVHTGCPGSMNKTFNTNKNSTTESSEHEKPIQSQLGHWPIQMHLISPHAPQYQHAQVVLAADCVAYSYGNFHSQFLQGKSLTIACPKLDSGKEIYKEKIKQLIDEAHIDTLTVLIMQVPCCGGLLQLAIQASKEAKRKVPIKAIVISVQGHILKEEWVSN